MKALLSLGLIILASCNSMKFEDKKVLVPDLEGTWEVCEHYSGSGGGADYKFTHWITDKGYTSREMLFGSQDGSCSTPYVQIVSVHGIALDTDIPALHPTAFPINVTYTTPKKITALASMTAALDMVSGCTGVVSPVAGTTYDVTEPTCGWINFTENAPVANQTVYTIFKVDKTVSPHTLELGGYGTPDTGLSRATRNEYLNSQYYYKQ